MSTKHQSSKYTLLAVLITAGSPAAAVDQSSLIAQNYPKESLARGEQGVVSFAVELDMDAKIDSCVVTKSSGYPLLDEATCDLIVKHAEFSPAESGGQRVATIRNGTVAWKLPKAYLQNARLAPPPIAVSKAELEAKRVICQRSGQTGSIVKSVAFCLTRAQWAAARAEATESGDKLMRVWNSNHGCHTPGRC